MPFLQQIDYESPDVFATSQFRAFAHMAPLGGKHVDVTSDRSGAVVLELLMLGHALP